MISEVADTIDALRDVGELVTLRRSGTSPVDVACLARIVDFQPQEIGGGVTQGDRKGIISNAEIAAAHWPGPPRRGDVVIYRGRTSTIQACDTLVVGSAIVRHNLHLRGG